jgi:hypothetical protein
VGELKIFELDESFLKILKKLIKNLGGKTWNFCGNTRKFCGKTVFPLI